MDRLFNQSKIFFEIACTVTYIRYFLMTIFNGSGSKELQTFIHISYGKFFHSWPTEQDKVHTALLLDRTVNDPIHWCLMNVSQVLGHGLGDYVVGLFSRDYGL